MEDRTKKLDAMEFGMLRLIARTQDVPLPLPRLGRGGGSILLMYNLRPSEYTRLQVFSEQLHTTRSPSYSFRRFRQAQRTRRDRSSTSNHDERSTDYVNTNPFSRLPPMCPPLPGNCEVCHIDVDACLVEEYRWFDDEHDDEHDDETIQHTNSRVDTMTIDDDIRDQAGSGEGARNNMEADEVATPSVQVEEQSGMDEAEVIEVVRNGEW